MSIILRILLIIVSLGLIAYVLRSVRKSKVQIDDMVFWIIFSVILLLIALVPQIAVWAAKLVGVISTVNAVYLVVIFVLLIKLFHMSVKLSQLETKIKTITQKIAVKECEAEEKAAEQSSNEE